MPSTSDYLDSLVARGIIGGDALERLLPGGPQRQSRADILRDTASDTAEALMPFSAMRYPDTPETRRAWDAATQGPPGKIPPVPGSSRFDPVSGGLLDIGSSMLPVGKAATALKFFEALPAALAAKADKLIEKGLSQQQIADELGVAKASIYRHLQETGQKTAAAENPSFWNAPGVEEGVKADLASGLSQARVAAKWGTTPGNIASKVIRWRAAGELSDVELRPSNQSKSVLADPVKRADIIRLAKEGESQGNIASFIYGGPGGKHPRRSDISAFIKQLQEEGTPEEREALKNYAPQGGTGLTPAGKTPSLPQLKSTAGPVDEAAGQDWVKALKAAGLLP